MFFRISASHPSRLEFLLTLLTDPALVLVLALVALDLDPMRAVRHVRVNDGLQEESKGKVWLGLQ